MGGVLRSCLVGRSREFEMPVLADLQLNTPYGRFAGPLIVSTAPRGCPEAVARCLAFSAYVWATHRAHKAEGLELCFFSGFEMKAPNSDKNLSKRTLLARY